MENCDKCHKEISFREYETIKLIGGLFVHLCLDCRNKWHEFIVNHDAIHKLSDLAAEENWLKCRAVANDIPLLGEMQSLTRRVHEVEHKIYMLSKEWLTNNI